MYHLLSFFRQYIPPPESPLKIMFFFSFDLKTQHIVVKICTNSLVKFQLIYNSYTARVLVDVLLTRAVLVINTDVHIPFTHCSVHHMQLDLSQCVLCEAILFCSF